MVGRPKLNGPKKKKLTLTVNDSKRELMARVSEALGVSISAFVEERARKAAKDLNDEVSLAHTSGGSKLRSLDTKTKNMSLTVSDATRELLDVLSDAMNMSITLMIECWIEEEARNLGII